MRGPPRLSPCPCLFTYPNSVSSTTAVLEVPFFALAPPTFANQPGHGQLRSKHHHGFWISTLAVMQLALVTQESGQTALVSACLGSASAASEIQTAPLSPSIHNTSHQTYSNITFARPHTSDMLHQNLSARVELSLLVQRSWLSTLTTVVSAPIWVAQAELLQRASLTIGARDRTRCQRCFCG